MQFLNLEDMSQTEIDRAGFWLQANRIVRQSGEDNFKKEKIPVNSSWNFEYLNRRLQCYHDKRVVEFFKYGFPLNANNTELQTSIPRNQKGARQHSKQINDYIKKQRKAGTIIGPFKRNPFGKYARFSPLDTRPKKDTEELRVIMNLSHPHAKGSVNHSVDKKMFQGSSIDLKYPSVDDLAKIVVKKGVGCKIFKRDLAKAYKQFFNCPGCIHLLGFVVDDNFYFDLTLCMGAASSAFFCQMATNAITFINAEDGYDNVNYLDDLGGAEVPEKADEAFDNLGNILQNINIFESKEKATPPCTRCVFLGIQFDSNSMALSITGDRLAEIQELLRKWMSKKSATLKEMQSLLGKLNFAASTIRAGRIFVSRLINAMVNFNNEETTEMPTYIQKDIQWWITYMASFDGVSLIPDYSWKKPGATFTTDACLTACGGWDKENFYHKEFPAWLVQRKDVHINELETMAIIIALKLWGKKVQNSNILLHCDNQPTVDIINTGKARNKFAQQCLREICFITAKLNTVIKVVFTPGVNNSTADKFSRKHLSRRHHQMAVEEANEKKLTETYVFEGLFQFMADW